MSTHSDSNGIVWVDRGGHTDDHLTHGGHETYLIATARAMLPEGGAFVDVGAHVGLYSLNLADKAGVVIAIEANPDTYSVLRQNVLNNEDRLSARIVTHLYAAWDRREPLAMQDPNGKVTGGSARCLPESEDENVVTFGVPLDESLPSDLKVDVVKIDVEGAEARVLKGMQKRIMKDHPVLLIEMHDMYYGEQIRLDVLAFLEALGYRWTDSLKYGGSYYILANPETPDQQVIEIVKAGQ